MPPSTFIGWEVRVPDRLKPFVVSVPEAARLQGRGRKPGGGRNAIYDQIANGELEAVKDGARTMVIVESIERRQANLPRIKPKTDTAT
jgi:hypothetical protein